MAKEVIEPVYKFLDRLSRSVKKILVDNGINPKENGAGFDLTVTMSEDQKHVAGLFIRYSKIIKTFKQMTTIARLMEVKPSIYFTNEAEVEYSEYLEYNLENYFLRITSILDQSVILVSEFYKLGLPPQSTSLKILRENTHTKDKEATKVIKELDRSLQSIKQIRNHIAHRGGVNDEDIMKIEANLYMLSHLPNPNINDPTINEMHDLIEELINKKIDFLKKNNVGVSEFLLALDRVLDAEYEG